MPAPQRQHPTDLTDVDLVPLLTHLSGRKGTREKIAQSTETRLLLEAGLELISEHFAVPPNQDSEEARHQAFRWISAPKVADIVIANKPDSRLSPGSEGIGKGPEYWSRTKAARWVNHDGFIADLLNVALHTQHWSVGVAQDHESLAPLLGGLHQGDFLESVRELAYMDVSVPIDSPSFQRMELLAVAMCEREPAFKSVIQKNYQSVDTIWEKLYESIFIAREWRLREGFTINDLNVILSTAATGMGMRGTVAPEGIVDNVARTSLLGKLCLALVAGCVDTGDGRSLDQVVQDIVNGRQEKPEHPVDREQE